MENKVYKDHSKEKSIVFPYLKYLLLFREFYYSLSLILPF